MLRFLGEEPAADALMTAVERTTWAGILTPDVGGTAGTAEVTGAVIGALLDSEIQRKSVG